MRFTLTIQSDKLPSTLQSLHHIRPARPSMVSQELGSDASGLNPKHLEASRSIFSSQCMQNRHQAQSRCKLLFLLRRQPCRRAPNRCSAPRRSFGGPSGAQRSKSAAASGQNDGGAERDRTADPLLAKQVLSQLSYSPISSIARIAPGSATFRVCRHFPTPIYCSKSICWGKWWAREDLNFRPHAYQACALTN